MAKHKIKVLKPLVPKPDATPQCCVKVNPPWRNSNWRKEHYGGAENDYTRCQRNSTVQIDDKYYCRLHAGQVALTILLEMQDAKTQPSEGSKAETQGSTDGAPKES